MLKQLDFAACEKRARSMTEAELTYARTDARRSAECWDGHSDPDGNAGYYRDEAATYAAELRRRVSRRS